MPMVDFDFQRYVERRKGALAAQAREGAAYAYSGDLKVLRTLDKLRPVRISVEATVRLWGQAARAELLGSATRVTAKESPRLFAVVEKCAQALHIAAPPVYLARDLGGLASGAFGTNEEAYLLFDRDLVDELTDPELADFVGRECGHLQNGHVVYLTALFYLTRFAGRFVRWIVKPATLALEGWSRRAAVTADRAGLLCTRDLGVSESVLRRLSGAPENPDESSPRVLALRLFAESAYFRGLVGEPDGLDPAACDAKVAEVLR
ncbi:MAG TPA: M48 family metalloprotease [Polyangia bacterium]